MTSKLDKGGLKVACQSYEELINKYVDGLANFGERARLEAHLDICPDCREYTTGLKKIVGTVSSLEQEELPSNLMSSLHERLKELPPIQSSSGGRKIFDRFRSIPALLYEGFIRQRRWLAPGMAVAAVAVVIMISIPFYFGASKSADMATGAAPAEAPQTAPQMMMRAAPFNLEIMEEQGKPKMEAFSNSMAQDVAAQEMKIIQNAGIFVWVEDLQEKVDYTINLAKEQGGYVESTSMSGQGDEYPRNAHIALRVPAETLTFTLDQISALGKLRYKNLSGENITEVYYDTDNRVRNLQKQEERLIEILAMANNVDEVLRIENELNRVRTDIDHMTGQLRAWDKRVQYSLVEVELREQEPSREKLSAFSVGSLWENAKRGFIAAVNVAAKFTITAATVLGALSPVIALGVVIAAVLYLRKRRRKGVQK